MDDDFFEGTVVGLLFVLITVVLIVKYQEMGCEYDNDVYDCTQYYAPTPEKETK